MISLFNPGDGCPSPASSMMEPRNKISTSSLTYYLEVSYLVFSCHHIISLVQYFDLGCWRSWSHMYRNCEVHGADIFPVQVGMILRSHSITSCPALNEVVSSGSKTGHGMSRNSKNYQSEHTSIQPRSDDQRKRRISDANTMVLLAINCYRFSMP
jgi:hypothetical protein